MSTDPYGIPFRLVKLSENIVNSYVADVFNHCVQNQVFPVELQLAKVIPVFKSSAKDFTSNYRPISLLSNFSKIYGKLMHKTLVIFIHTVLIT